jgi:hypothetical protein
MTYQGRVHTGGLRGLIDPRTSIRPALCHLEFFQEEIKINTLIESYHMVNMSTRVRSFCKPAVLCHKEKSNKRNLDQFLEIKLIDINTPLRINRAKHVYIGLFSAHSRSNWIHFSFKYGG